METTAITQHVDREALVVQLRALAAAVEHLAGAIEQLAPEDAEAIGQHLEEARWQLKRIW